jgi:hypothetical protein
VGHFSVFFQNEGTRDFLANAIKFSQKFLLSTARQ